MRNKKKDKNNSDLLHNTLSSNKKSEILKKFSSLIKEPGDEISQYKTPRGDIITKIIAKYAKATHRQYSRKNGEKGKQTMIIMQPEDKKK